MENKLYGHIKSFFIHIIYFQTNYSNFCRLFWRIWYVCGNNGPLPNVTFSALYFKHSLINWRLKFMEMTECLQNFRFHRKFNSNYSIEVKQKLIEKFRYQKTILLMTYVGKTSYFVVAPPGHIIAYNLLKNGYYVF